MTRVALIGIALSGLLLACDGTKGSASPGGAGGHTAGGLGGTSGVIGAGGVAGASVAGGAAGTRNGGDAGAGGTGGSTGAKDASQDRAELPDVYAGDTVNSGGAAGSGGAQTMGGAPGSGGVVSGCGNAALETDEGCDDGNQSDGDGCSHDCKVEDGFICDTVAASQTCQSGLGQCLRLPVIYRDFQPENATSGGHPDFYSLGSKWNGSATSTTICVPNSAGPVLAGDATPRCWGIAADTLLDGKPQLGSTTTCACQFSDWSLYNDSRIQGGYSQVGNDSPLSDGKGGYLGGTAGATVNVTGASGTSTGKLVGFTAGTPAGPIWSGTVPAVKDAASFKQWFSDDSTVNKTFNGVLELGQTGSDLSYTYASSMHLGTGGFFPLDTLNPTQKTLCNLFPYWNHGNGKPIWTICQGDQYLFPPRVAASECMTGDQEYDGCWVLNTTGETHDYYFTSEIRQPFVYDGARGIQLTAYVDGDFWVFINGQLVLDLGSTHQALPGRVTVTGDPGAASIVEGGCLDSTGDIIGTTSGSTVCSFRNASPPRANNPDDFRVRTVPLGLVTGKTYELSIFHANRSPVESNLQITLTGFAGTTTRSICRRQ